MTLDAYFDKIVCINLDRRTDRWAECEVEIRKQPSLLKMERIAAVDNPTAAAQGCLESHLNVLKMLINHPTWRNMLVFEDDFQSRYDELDGMFSMMVKQVPVDWDMLYLGGMYGEPPLRRIARHVIKPGRFMQTGAYAITKQFAAKHYGKLGLPIDASYAGLHTEENNCFVFQPRLFVQRKSYSDVEQRFNEHPEWVGTDETHERMV